MSDATKTIIDDAELLEIAQRLVNRYTSEPVPPCRVCGQALSIASAGGGNATVYACDLWEDDSENPGQHRRKSGRSAADDHYSNSRWTQYRGGDGEVLLIVRAMIEERGLTMPEVERDRY